MTVNTSTEHDWRTALMSVLMVKPGGMSASSKGPRGQQRKLDEAKGNYKFWTVWFISALSWAPLIYSSSLVLQERENRNEWAKMNTLTLQSCSSETGLELCRNRHNENVFHSSATKLPRYLWWYKQTCIWLWGLAYLAILLFPLIHIQA